MISLVKNAQCNTSQCLTTIDGASMHFDFKFISWCILVTLQFGRVLSMNHTSPWTLQAVCTVLHTPKRRRRPRATPTPTTAPIMANPTKMRTTTASFFLSRFRVSSHFSTKSFNHGCQMANLIPVYILAEGGCCDSQ